MVDRTAIPNSIINPDATAFNDAVTPYPYLSFIKFFTHSNTLNLLSDYNEYVRIWNNVKVVNVSQSTIESNIKTRYIELLDEINLNYINEDEQRFLSNLDITSNVDKNLLIPFYVKKINEITNYFIKKREDLKFTVRKNITGNSKQSISTQIKNFIIDELLYSGEYIGLSDYTKDTLYQNLEIDILEKYDTFSHYYDIDPETSVNDYNVRNELFKTYFNNNILDYDKIAFVDEESYLVQAIREYPLFIKEFGFSFSTVSNTSNIDAFKKKDFIDYKKTTSVDDLNIQTYKQLSQKYAGTDMYCMSSNGVDCEIVKMFDAEASNKNILNKKYTSIQNIPSYNFTDKRDSGTFFLPNNQGISFYKTYNKQYSVKSDLPSGICYFPDPEICGNIYNTSLTQLKNYPYSWTSNINNFLYEKSYLNIAGEVNTNKLQHFHGFLNSSHDCTLSNNFEELSNTGIIYSYGVDIYGNEYGILKQKPVISPDANIQTNVFENIITKPAIAGGISYTDVLTNNKKYEEYVNAWCREYGYERIFDGGGLTPEPEITTDYKEWPSVANAYYYDILLDAGVVENELYRIHYTGSYNGFPVRPFEKSLDSSALILSAGFINGLGLNSKIYKDCFNYDGGCFIEDKWFDNNLYNTSTTTFVNNITSYDSLTEIQSTSIIADSNYERMNQIGEVYIRYNNALNTQSLISELDFIVYKDENTEFSINTIETQNIEVIQDVLIITHKNGIIFNKITLNEYGYLTKSNIPIYWCNNVGNNNSSVEIIYSKYFYIEKLNAVIFAKLTKTFNDSIKNGETTFDTIIPTIYMLYIDDLHIETIFKVDDYNKRDFSLNQNPQLFKNIAYIETPTITYNSLNNLFSLTYIIHDLLNLPHLVNITFAYQLTTTIIITNDIYLADNIEFLLPGGDNE